MWRILQQAVADPAASPTICVLDALDECCDDDRQDLISLLCDFHQKSAKINSGDLLKFLITSRPYDNVQRWFRETVFRWPLIRLRGEDENEQIHNEINLVIRERVNDIAEEFSLTEITREQLEQQLLAMQNRTYLWLYLAMEEIRDAYQASFNPKTVVIPPIPASVEDAYERLLQRISEKHKLNARKILLIIAGARRPLTTFELCQALGAAHAHEHDLTSLELPDHNHLKSQIRLWCGLFVFIQDDKLFLIHQTAKEFLLSDNPNIVPDMHKWRSCLTTKQVEAEMAAICATYLCFSKGTLSLGRFRWMQKEADKKRYQKETDTFLHYCEHHCTQHLSDEAIGNDKKLLGKVLTFFNAQRRPFTMWWPGTYTPEFAREYGILCQHLAAFFGYTNVLAYLTAHGSVDLEASTSSGRTALAWAVGNGQVAAARWLLSASASIRRDSGAQALIMASRIGNDEIVQILVNIGIGIKDHSHGIALIAASLGGSLKVIQILVDAGAYLDAKDNNGATALIAPSGQGFVDTVQALINAGAYLNAKDNVGATALIAASKRGFVNIVQALINAGANLDAEDHGGATALIAASERGFVDTVQALIDAGAYIEAEDHWGRTALIAASKQGFVDIIQALIDAGAYLEAEDRWGRTALIAASERSITDLMHVLINTGAFFDTHDGWCIILAPTVTSEQDFVGTVQVLINAGACLNAKANNGYTALTQASKRGFVDIVQTLINAEANVNMGSASPQRFIEVT